MFAISTFKIIILRDGLIANLLPVCRDRSIRSDQKDGYMCGKHMCPSFFGFSQK